LHHSASFRSGPPACGRRQLITPTAPRSTGFAHLRGAVAANSRMTIAVHALAWLALAQRQGHEVLTSSQVSASVNTNAVIIRRCLGDLRRAGLVSVIHGESARR